MTPRKINVYAQVDPAIAQQVDPIATRLDEQRIGREARYRIAPDRAARQTVHVTLFMTDYPEGTQAEILERVQTFARTTPRFAVTTDGLTRTRNGWLFLAFERSERLEQATVELARRLSPLRVADQAAPGWMARYPEKQASFMAWGSPNVGSSYEPHVTLLAEAPMASLEPLFPSPEAMHADGPKVTGSLDAIGVGEADDAGQITKVLGHFPLK